MYLFLGTFYIQSHRKVAIDQKLKFILYTYMYMSIQILIYFIGVSKQAIDETSTRRAVITVGLIFVTSLTALFYIYTSFPELEK